jgi:hypothetical protein
MLPGSLYCYLLYSITQIEVREKLYLADMTKSAIYATAFSRVLWYNG